MLRFSKLVDPSQELRASKEESQVDPSVPIARLEIRWSLLCPVEERGLEDHHSILPVPTCTCECSHQALGVVSNNPEANEWKNDRV